MKGLQSTDKSMGVNLVWQPENDFSAAPFSGRCGGGGY
jgi:hypothetical protein